MLKPLYVSLALATTTLMGLPGSASARDMLDPCSNMFVDCTGIFAGGGGGGGGGSVAKAASEIGKSVGAAAGAAAGAIGTQVMNAGSNLGSAAGTLSEEAGTLSEEDEGGDLGSDVDTSSNDDHESGGVGDSLWGDPTDTKNYWDLLTTEYKEKKRKYYNDIYTDEDNYKYLIILLTYIDIYKKNPNDGENQNDDDGHKNDPKPVVAPKPPGKKTPPKATVANSTSEKSAPPSHPAMFVPSKPAANLLRPSTGSHDARSGGSSRGSSDRGSFSGGARR